MTTVTVDPQELCRIPRAGILHEGELYRLDAAQRATYRRMLTGLVPFIADGSISRDVATSRALVTVKAHPAARSHRDRIDAAFRDLEQRGFLCRANYMCCQTCAWSAIGGWDPEKDGKPGSESYHYGTYGVVFWHKQSHDAFGSEGVLDNILFLHWGAAEPNLIVEALRRQGLVVGWDGTEADAMLVYPDEAYMARCEREEQVRGATEILWQTLPEDGSEVDYAETAERLGIAPADRLDVLEMLRRYFIRTRTVLAVENDGDERTMIARINAVATSAQ